MNLTSDFPFWSVKSGLTQVFPPLEKDVHCDALIIGGGITGALLAKRLVQKGVDCVLIEGRDVGQGSTSASTALLQYEIDTPLYKLRSRVGQAAADQAYRMGLESIHRLQKLAGSDCGFRLRSSLQIAAAKSDVPGLKQEFAARRSIRLPAVFLDSKELLANGIHSAGALRSSAAAEMDPYLFTHRLLRLASRSGVRIFDRTTATRYSHSHHYVTVSTNRRAKVRCKAVFFATGYETSKLLPPGIVTFKTTYALVSEPIANLDWWPDQSLIWSTGTPYTYMRTTSDRRVIVGGEDDSTLNTQRREKNIGRKTGSLLVKFRSVFTHAPAIEVAFAWAGVFGSTKDGLGYIGRHKSFPRAYFALGFGGNGITFSEIASRLLPDLFLGRSTEAHNVFRFDR